MELNITKKKSSKLKQFFLPFCLFVIFYMKVFGEAFEGVTSGWMAFRIEQFKPF